MNAAEVLDAALAAGVRLAAAGSTLVLASSDPPPPAVLDLLRAHKSEIMAAIAAANVVSHETDDAVVDWRGWYEERAAIRQFDGGYTREEAARFAWGEAEDRWHRAHGEQISRDLCAGCRRRIGEDEALDLADGSRVHFDGGNGCLIKHGERWRTAATRALSALGLRPPATAAEGGSR
jgi:hypothetical protein